MGALIPFGLLKEDERLVDVASVPKGRNYGCIPLPAKCP